MIGKFVRVDVRSRYRVIQLDIGSKISKMFRKVPYTI
jgi:hypothetical protein